MKNKKKNFFSLFFSTILTFSTASLFAQQDFHLSIEPLFGIRNGVVNEFVYHNTSSNTNKLSELNWDISNIRYFGGKTELQYKNFSFDFSAAGAIPQRSHNMQDSDWMNVSNPSMKTTYSISENTLENSFFIDFGFNYTIPIVNFFSIKTSLNYNFENFSFSAKNGYGWYGNNKSPMVSWDDPTAPKFEKGSLGGITYERKSSNISIGIAPSFYLFNRFQIELYGAIAPFTYLESVDHHLNTNESIASDWLDKGSTFFNSWNAGGSIAFYPFNQLAIKTDFKYSQINFYKGNTYKNDSGYQKNSDSLSGFSQNYFTFTLSLIYRPF